MFTPLRRTHQHVGEKWPALRCAAGVLAPGMSKLAAAAAIDHQSSRGKGVPRAPPARRNVAH